MKINNYQSNQTFGMAIHSNSNVNKILQSRIKKAKDLEKLNIMRDFFVVNTDYILKVIDQVNDN